MEYITFYSSPLGEISLLSDGTKLNALWIPDQKYYADQYESSAVLNNDLEVFKIIKEWLDRYFRGETLDIKDLPLEPKGSFFRERVWKILADIPYGKTMTYGEVAKVLAEQMNKKVISAQAVGGAVGHNPISIIIPCHRVMGAKGNLTGYTGGLDKKIKLLQIEKVDMTSFYMPKKGTAL